MATDYDYLIIGGGMTADAAAKGIREQDKDGSIALIGDDTDAPYTRPALSKKLWTDPDFTQDDNWLNTVDETGATLMTGTRVTAIDPDQHQVTLENGERLGYKRLLLATGGTPKTLDVPAGERVIYFRTLEDYRQLRRLSGDNRRIAVVGGSYIGTELAAALVQNDTRATLIYPDEVLCGAMFPADLAQHFEKTYRDQGVELCPRTQVESGSPDEEGVTLKLSDGSEQRFDAMVSGLGIEPCVELAENAGLEVDDGIIVDEYLRTSVADIYAAGDVARYPDQILGRRRIEHVNNATQMGGTVGRIMAGSDEAYRHTPYYYSHVFDMDYMAVGTLDASLTTVEDWAEPLKKGVIYYLDGERVAGVLLWNLGKGLKAAREVLADTSPQDESTLKGRITMSS
ncbi:NAD(P)/FAD-dependent oxidoreductase [Pistricoccus aurantiacus]|uniref:NAD(P)/FAD-dependent oxidoreductase n=1 Tax=Pistricoccus aurantiacus TaxID=1883414 RepID=UPI0036409CFA